MGKERHSLKSRQAGLVIKLLVEGNSVRSAERISGVRRDTILRVLNIVGTRCDEVLDTYDTYIKNIPLQTVHADEFWGFVGCKQTTKNAPLVPLVLLLALV